MSATSLEPGGVESAGATPIPHLGADMQAITDTQTSAEATSAKAKTPPNGETTAADAAPLFDREAPVSFEPTASGEPIQANRRVQPSAASQLAPAVVLIVVAAAWGASFPLTKDLLVRMPVLDFLGLRFAIAGAVGAVVLAPQLWRADWGTWWRGVALGAVYALSQILQTYGLDRASASVSGFLTALYVVGTPVVAWLLWRVRLARSTLLAVLLAFAGAAVLGLAGLHVGAGELLLVSGAVGYSFHVVLLGRWSVGRNALALGAIQMIALAVIHAPLALEGGLVLPQGARQWGVMVFLAVIGGLVALLGQTWAQARMDAARAAVIMAMEPVFSAVFAVLLVGELVTLRLLVGGSLIFAGSVVAELEPLLRRRRLVAVLRKS
ncbi:Predicted permease, DMT superfamily [Actinomyces bovis]|uniref:Predicted permease, DMT superfamily n=1 Tax=Actinomyces bovis TaxID=1658 RepID=A0ABY1VLL1_9ACTO|nr:DMT family transporter [Actinomyces bovis]SPT52980.1 Predicted permease, DMT superfamily [Actinomyces bovis]VEG55200.1 Predicted permease, DMT superfamily [Actinomyces israelii]